MDPVRLRALLGKVIEQAPPFEGREELLLQVPTADATGGPVTMLDLVVDRGLPPSPFPGKVVPGCSWAHDEDGSALGVLTVWLDAGYISSLDFGWVTDEPPSSLPDPSTLAAG
jgi:hypothetical protein